MNEAHHPISKEIVSLLLSLKISFRTYEHEAVRTSEEAAAVRPEYTLSQGTKALIVRVKQGGEKKFVMVVVAGDKKFDPKKLRSVFGLSDTRFATEEEVKMLTGGVQPGGVPPIGPLFGLEVYADRSVFESGIIIFNAGDRRFSVSMHSNDYRAIASPKIGNIAY